ncbi:MAG: ACT domain-containing protein [Oscillospiraceae bacterium]|nr:ACT domain-containing protein [Oscillospiraceae bacterium]MDY4586111.1 ACT domain-containing protein [Oscillospiraceae bacterium]
MAKKFLLVDSDALPDVFLKVVRAKELLAAGSVKNLSAAAKEVDISRSAMYKYKDKVFDVSEAKTVVAVHVVLMDETGALQNLLKIIARYNVSIVTITQSAPVDGTAAVSITMKVKDMVGDVDSLVEEMKRRSFVVTAKRIMQDI